MDSSSPIMIHSALDIQKRAQDSLKNRLNISVLDNASNSASDSEDSEIDYDENDKHKSWRFKEFAKKYELSRKGFHSSTGLFTVWLYANGYNQRQLVIPLICMATICFLQDFIRFRSPAFNATFIKLYGFMMRDSEKDKYNGILFFLLGIIITSAFLPKDLAIMCNCLLSWADTSASFFGRLYGKYTFKISGNKSFAGCAASFATGVLVCYLMYALLIPLYGNQVDLPGDILYNRDTSKLNLHVYAILSGFIASLSEGINIMDIDDNFTIPVLSGALLYGIVSVLQ